MTGRRMDAPGGFERVTGIIPQPPIPQPADHLLGGWTFDPADQQAGTILPTAGLLNVARIRVGNVSAATGIMVYVTAAGVTLTANQCLAALFTDGGALLGAGAVTGNQATAWQSTGLKPMALTVAQAITPYAWYRVGWYANGSTLPTFARGANVAAAALNAGMSAPTLRYSTADSGLTTAMPLNLGAQTASSPAWWAAIY